ncbi:hypothetical protein [Halobacillus salinus]|uniref:hypothetical protein n=1 Tax=Halobacillus salinus TaxID=192814 RepID=UPI00159283E3|nr:hypothetical protein [Halobacillus salinus]
MIRFLLLSLFLVTISGCANPGDESISLSSMMEEKKPIGSVEIRDDQQVINMNEEAKTSKQGKIDEFKSMVADIELKRVEKSDISEVGKEYAKEDSLLKIFIANEENKDDVLVMDLAGDGGGLVVSFEDGGASQDVYEIQNGNAGLYEEVHDFYESIRNEVTLDQN